jgi:transcriptional regulator with XRE-family HTH domain
MDPTPEQLEAFAADLRRRRTAAGLSTTELAARAQKIVGTKLRIQRQDIENWEKQHIPRKIEKVVALDQALAAEGELVALLERPGLAADVRRLERQLRAQGRQLKKVLEILDAQGDRG